MSRPTAFPERRRAAVITAWVLQILLGVAIAGGGLLKLTGDPAMVEMFVDIGAGQWLRFVVGVLEVAGGLGLLVPRVRALAALGLLLLLLGAAVVNVAVLHTGPLGALAFAVVALAVLLLRRHELPGKPHPATRGAVGGGRIAEVDLRGDVCCSEREHLTEPHA